jgi:hypothetical protein
MGPVIGITVFLMDNSSSVVYYGRDLHSLDRIIVYCGRDCPPVGRIVVLCGCDSTAFRCVIVVCVRVSAVNRWSAATGTAWCQSAVIGVQRYSFRTPPSLGFRISHSLGVCAWLDDSLFRCLGNESLWHLSGTCLIVDCSWALPLCALVPPFICSLENEWVFPSCGVTWS